MLCRASKSRPTFSSAICAERLSSARRWSVVTTPAVASASRNAATTTQPDGVTAKRFARARMARRSAGAAAA
jgi:hypothetical protein